MAMLRGNHSDREIPARGRSRLSFHPLPPDSMHADECDSGHGKPSLRERLMSHLVQTVPEEIAICEFNCTKLQCSHSDWENCQRRLDSLKHDPPAGS